MDVPTAAAVREWAATNAGDGIDWSRFGYAAPTAGDPDRLDRVVARAISYVEQMTGRKLDATLPDDLEPLAEDAVLMRVGQVLVGRGATRDLRSSIKDADVVSLRAGDFQITRAGPVRSGPGYAVQVNPWRELSDTLLLLATPERRAELVAEWSGQVPPAALVVETTPTGRGYSDLDPEF